jgi:ubiquinone/menaquinone biosynthesis C-methylase UbiE
MLQGLPIPPEDLRAWVGPFADADLFRHTGERQVQSIVELCGLKPDVRILEVGCGCGRLALALARHLGRQGSYDGFDVAAPLLEWCRLELEPRLPNFRFHLAHEVWAGGFNASGRIDAAAFTFPYPSSAFDLVILASVLTHMLPEGIENYAAETARVLKPGGAGFLTVMLFDEVAANAVRDGTTIFDFRHRIGPCWTFDAERPEEGIACEERWLLELLDRQGLRVEALRRGDWRDVRSYAITHDYIVARKA